MKRPSQKKLKKKLFDAVYDDNLPAVYEALSDGVDIDSRDEDGWTALMIAADRVSAGSRQVMRELLRMGANPALAAHDGTTALMLAVTVLAAFAFARLEFRGKDIAFTLFLALMMIPNELVIITNFVTMKTARLDNTFLGLILPSLEYGGKWGLLITIAGIFAGAVCLNLVDKLVPHLHRLAGAEDEAHPGSGKLSKVLLFVTAIAIHNLPEGIAAGVSFGSGNDAEALLIAGGIALQNVPEGMVIIGPMLAAGVSPKRTFLLALGTGLIEVVGTLLGYLAVSVATAILPFALAFAGGTMLYVISDEMIPETHHGETRGVTYALLVGFCIMLISDVLLG